MYIVIGLMVVLGICTLCVLYIQLSAASAVVKSDTDELLDMDVLRSVHG